MNDETFKGVIIDDEEHQAELKFRNFIPKGVRTLGRMFNLDNKFRKPANVKTHSSSLQFELIDLGTKAEPKGVSSSVYSSSTRMCLLGPMNILKLMTQISYNMLS